MYHSHLPDRNSADSAGFGTCTWWLPRSHRAGPSTSLDELSSCVGGIGLEPTTSAMSKQCSNQLS